MGGGSVSSIYYENRHVKTDECWGDVVGAGELLTACLRTLAHSRSASVMAAARGQEENYSHLEKTVAQASPSHEPSTLSWEDQGSSDPAQLILRSTKTMIFLSRVIIHLPASSLFCPVAIIQEANHPLELIVLTTPFDSECYGL